MEEEDLGALISPEEEEREGFRIAWNKGCLKARDSKGINWTSKFLHKDGILLLILLAF